jgi:hypothetical protein
MSAISKHTNEDRELSEEELIRRANKNIEPKVYTPSQIKALYTSKLLGKPDFQRAARWLIHLDPKKQSVPNMQAFISFLYESRNAQQPISMGNYDGINQLIDGNNRTNAILNFVINPYLIFPDSFEDIENSIDEVIYDEKERECLKDYFRNRAGYKILWDWANEYDIWEIEEPELLLIYEKNLKKWRPLKKTIMNWKAQFGFKEETQRKNGKVISKKVPINFLEDIKIPFNIFRGYTKKELNKNFKDMNKYTSGLSIGAQLASTLRFVMIQLSNLYKYKLLPYVEKYYEGRNKSWEVLEQYKIDPSTYQFNPFDILVALHNKVVEDTKFTEQDEYGIIEKYEKKESGTGYPLIMKFYECTNSVNSKNNLGQGITPDSCTDENMEKFCEEVSYIMDLIKETLLDIAPTNITNVLYDAKSKNWMYKMGDNRLLVLFKCIKRRRRDMNETDIKSKLKIAIVYNLLTSLVKNTQDKKRFNVDNPLAVSGHWVGLWDDEQDVIDKLDEMITEEKFRNLVEYFVSQSNNPGLKKNRGKWNAGYRLLHSLVFMKKAPIDMVSKVFSVEHIFPHSTMYEGECDLDRPGNTFPTFHHINVKRRNGDLSIYYEPENKDYIDAFGEIIPSNEQYHKVVSYESIGSKPKMVNMELYNEICERNERLCIDTIVNKYFPSIK